MIRTSLTAPSVYSGNIIRRWFSSSVGIYNQIKKDSEPIPSNHEQSSTQSHQEPETQQKQQSQTKKEEKTQSVKGEKQTPIKVSKHIEFLKKYYTPELLQSIQIAESVIDPKQVLELKKLGFRANSKVAPTNEFSDYSTNDPIWSEPIIYPNQADGRAPYPEIPDTRSSDRSDLKLRFKDEDTTKKSNTALRTNRQISEDLSKLTGLDARYIKNLYVRPIVMKRVSLKTSKGNIPNFFVLTVVGDKRGTIGLGIGKSRDGIRTAALKAHWNAVKNLTPIPRYENRTILGDFEYKFHAVKLFMKSAPAGFGLRVNHNIFEICQAAGIKDLRGKVYRSRNPLLVAQGFVEALTKQKSIEDLAAGRGKKIVDLNKVYYSH
ncbi:mitochondrial ribosomal protein S5 [Scheffersomyces amazonensis]|uniref:mitochondrial ribosomal protein S5 n=1 Tax=Scheffersomyces amazonensis TaxID=1078765 RepID=UPI00315C5859